MKSERKQVINGFQGLRGFAIILIVISHCMWRENIYKNNILTWAGAWGVSIFLMISRFLAVEKNWNQTFSIQKVGELVKYKVSKYYVLYFITFLASLPFAIREQRAVVVIINAMINMLQLEVLFPKSGIYFAFNSVSWYLSLDLLLTLFLPGILFFLRKMNKQYLKSSILGIWIVQFIIAFFSDKFINPNWITYISPYTRWMDYFVGGGIAILCKKIKQVIQFI